MEEQIVGVNLLDDGSMEIAYIHLPTDAKKNGLLWKHAVHVPVRSDYDDELEAVMDALNALLADVLEDRDTAEAVELEEPDEDDEEEE